MPSHSFRNQKGNVLFLILIAVVLFAALSYAVTKSSHYGGTDSGSAEKNKLVISTLQTYTAELSSALNRLVLTNSCPLENVSFESTKWPSGNADYVNNYAPTTKKCHVFAPEGGNVIWKNPVSQQLTGNDAPLITGIVGVHKTSATCSNGAVVIMAAVTHDICLQINNDLKVVNTGGAPPQWASGPGTLNANFMRFGFRSHTSAANMACGSTIGATGVPSAPELAGFLTGCFQSTTGSKGYIYYSVLYRK